MVTNVCKVTLGRLRPHFMAVCSPNITVSGHSGDSGDSEGGEDSGDSGGGGW